MYNSLMPNWNLPVYGLGFILIILWESFWKLIGLWRAAKKGDKLWFVAIFIINLFGIIPLFYLWHTKQLNGVLEEIKTFFNSRFNK